jgi:predicted ArsR family transcriptional regulator
MGTETTPKQVTPVRRSSQRDQLLTFLLRSARAEWSATDLEVEAGVPIGTLYGLLLRLTGAGWLDRREEHSGRRGRPTALYSLTASGRTEATEQLIAVATARKAAPYPVPGLSPGWEL